MSFKSLSVSCSTFVGTDELVCLIIHLRSACSVFVCQFLYGIEFVSSQY